MYTFLSLAEIETIMQAQNKAPNLRVAQKKLAAEVTELVHGRHEATKAVNASNALYGNTPLGTHTHAALPSIKIREANTTIVAIAADAFGISKSEVRRLIEAKGIRLNGETVVADKALTDADYKDDSALLEKGKVRILIRK